MIPISVLTFFVYTPDAYHLPKMTLVALFLCYLLIRNNVLPNRALLKPICLVILSICATSIFSGDFYINFFGKHSSRYVCILGIAICTMVYMLPYKKQVRAIRFTSLIVSIYCLSQFWVTQFRIDDMAGRTFGSIGSPPMMGAALACMFPFVHGLEAVILILAMLSTGSRAGVLAIIVGWFVYRHLRGRKIPQYAYYSALLAIPYILWRVKSDKLRLMTWEMALRVWYHYPILGCGSETWIDAFRKLHTKEWHDFTGSMRVMTDYGHNDILHALSAFGIIGLIVYLYFNLKLYQHLKSLTRSAYNCKVITSIISVLICAKFNAVPFAVLVLVAVIVSSAESTQRVRKMGFLVIPNIAMAITLSVMLYSDLLYNVARTLFTIDERMGAYTLKRAADFNPYEITYRVKAVDTLIALYERDKNADNLREVVGIGREEVRKHPSSVLAQHILCVGLYRLLKVEGPSVKSDFEKEYKILNRMDPLLSLQSL